MHADTLTPHEADILARELGLDLADVMHGPHLPDCANCGHPEARRLRCFIGEEADTFMVCEDPVACYTRQLAREVELARESRGRRQKPIGAPVRSPYMGRRRR